MHSDGLLLLDFSQHFTGPFIVENTRAHVPSTFILRSVHRLCSSYVSYLDRIVFFVNFFYFILFYFFFSLPKYQLRYRVCRQIDGYAKFISSRDKSTIALRMLILLEKVYMSM